MATKTREPITAENLRDVVLESKYGEYQYLAKGPLQTSWRDGFPKQEPKLISLQFERFLCEVRDEIDRQELTEEDQQYLAAKLQHDLSDTMYRDMWVHEPVKPDKPWPSYEETDVKQIAVVAKATGLVEQALTYERRRDDGPREDVVKELSELQEFAGAIDLTVNEDDFTAV